jgi:hypothetical protein
MSFVGYHPAVFQDQPQVAHIGDVLERIGADHNEIGDLDHPRAQNLASLRRSQCLLLATALRTAKIRLGDALASATCSVSGATKPICQNAVRRTGCARRRAGGSRRRVVVSTRLPPSAATKVSPKCGVTPAQPAGRGWRNQRWRRSPRPFPSATKRTKSGTGIYKPFRKNLQTFL